MSLSQEIYRDLVRGIKINSINVHSMNITTVNSKLKESKSIDIDDKFTVTKYNIDGDKLEVYINFNIKSYEIGNEEKVGFIIDFAYCIEYEKENLAQFDEEYIKFFTTRNVPVNIWPYARELISSLTTRMGYPTLIIETLTV